MYIKMALNFSHRPIFPAHISEDNLASPIRIANGYLVEGIPEKNGDGFGKSWHSNRDVEDTFAYGRDRCERGGSQESVSNDILDLLPSDPFGMDISTTFTAITSWLEDLEVDYRGYGNDEVGASDGSYRLFAELNIFFNKAVRFRTLPLNTRLDHESNMACGFRGCCEEKAGGDASGHGGFGSSCGLNDILTFGNESMGKTIQHSQDLGDDNGVCFDGDGAPNGALLFALGYLGVQDLLLVERVCKTLCSTVRSDPLLWRSIHIDQPLNEKITDDVLLQLANRAQGNLQCLSLVECPRITDDGLKRVLKSNPRLTKVSIPYFSNFSSQLCEFISFMLFYLLIS